MEDVTYVMEYTNEKLDGEWYVWRTYDRLCDAVEELGIEAASRTHLKHRLVKEERITERTELLTIKEQGE